MLELVVVLSMLGILGAVGIFVVPRAVQNSRAKRAASEIQLIQQGLEAYRARFGDYPRLPKFEQDSGDSNDFSELSSGNAYLLNALFGRLGPLHDTINVAPMLNSSSLTFEIRTLPIGSTAGLVKNQILDPWGKPYFYDYRPADTNWDTFGYILYSLGPDRVPDTEDDIVAK